VKAVAEEIIVTVEQVVENLELGAVIQKEINK